MDQGRIRTLCPIMDILCSVGCRLKMMMSPSYMCRSTCTEDRQLSSLPFALTLRWFIFLKSRLIADLQMKVTWFGVKAQIDSVAVITYDVFGPGVLAVASPHKFLQSDKKKKKEDPTSFDTVSVGCFPNPVV